MSGSNVTYPDTTPTIMQYLLIRFRFRFGTEANFYFIKIE